MRIFPEGHDQTVEPTARALIIFAKMLIGFAILAFCWRAVELAAWRRVSGDVALTGVTCGQDNAANVSSYATSYSVGGKTYTLYRSESDYYTDCGNVIGPQQVFPTPVGHSTVLYDPSDPGNAYENGGKSLQFFLVAFVTGI